jgi:hypothetical protein
MSETQTTTNEFGTQTSATVVDDGSLNQQGKETTLNDILAAIRGQNVEKAPAAAPAPEATAAPAPAADADPVVDAAGEFSTGNKALDIAVSSFVKSTGATDADIQRACQNAIDYGDVNLIDKSFLAERFKDRAADATALVEAVVEQAVVEKQRTVDAVFELAGGKDQWTSALQVYKQHAPAGLQKALGLMFNSGDAASVKEAAQMVVEYAKGSGVLSNVSQGRQVASAGMADSSGLSQQEFQAAIGKLNQSSRTYVQDYERLIGMRRIGKQLGK